MTGAGLDCQHFKDSALTGDDGAWVGYYIQVTTPDGVCQRKIIQSYDASTHMIGFGWSSGYQFVSPLDPDNTEWIGDALYNAGAVYALPPGATYQIMTNWTTHPAGSKVYLARSSYTYVVNDAPSSKVYYVEGYGNPIIYIILRPVRPVHLDGARAVVLHDQPDVLHAEPERHDHVPRPVGDEHLLQLSALADGSAAAQRRSVDHA